jgi:hypothetical protein
MIRQQRAEAAKKRDEEKAGTSAAICISLQVQIFLLLIYEWLQMSCLFLDYLTLFKLNNGFLCFFLVIFC